MLGKVWEVLRGLKLVDSEGVVAAALLAVQNGDSLWNEISGMMEVLTEAGATWEQQEVFKTAAATMNGKAIDWARKGASGANWVRALTTLGVEPNTAKSAIQKLNVILRKGSAQVWKAFIKQVHHGDPQGINQADAANGMVREIFEEETDNNLIMMGKAVMTWTMAKKKKWIVRYVELEPKVGRRNAILQAKDRDPSSAEPGKRAMKALFEDAKAAAARKRRRRGEAAKEDEPMPNDLTLLMDPDLRRHQEEQGLLTLKGVRGAVGVKKDAVRKKLQRKSAAPASVKTLEEGCQIDEITWEKKQQEQVGAQVCTGKAELESGCGQGQSCNEVRGSKNATQGTDQQLHNPTAKNTMKRPREAPTRLGCRRMRENEKSTPDDDDESHELVKRGASTMDCKRRCENSGIS